MIGKIVCTQYKVITNRSNTIEGLKPKTVFLPDEKGFDMIHGEQTSFYRPIAGWRIKFYNNMEIFQKVIDTNPWMGNNFGTNSRFTVITDGNFTFPAGIL